MNIEWQKYRTIENYGYRNRSLIAGGIVSVLFLFIWSYPVVFCYAKWVDLFEGRISVSPILGAGPFILFLLFILYTRRITKKQPCPKCGQRCEELESNASGQVYLVCHDCKLKWDTGLNNSN